MNKEIFKCRFGSIVYGTSVPTSDVDLKSIFVPDPRELVLQRAAKHIQNNTKKDNNAKNSADDIDYESFSYSEYLRNLCDGQTFALDMLFCPEEFVLIDSLLWQELKVNKSRFLHKGTAAFVGYTKQQAAKYGVKGFRVSALRDALEFLKTLDPSKTLGDYAFQIGLFVFDGIFDNKLKNIHISLVKIKEKNGMEEPYLQVCNRKVPFHATVKYAREVYQKVFDKYGQRAMMAERNEGIDWKALNHAVRVAREAEELLLTGNITFPRPEKNLLLKIRKGEMDYKDVEAIIEEGLVKIEEAQRKSILPEKPDFKFVEELIFNCYKNIIRDII